LNAPGKIGFDDDGQPVGVTEFNYDEVEADARDRDATLLYYREKLAEFVRFTCDALLSGNPSAEIAGRRAYFFALALKQPPFASQNELAAHLGLSKGAISQQLNAFVGQNPLLSQSKRESN
jgi:hypothetical protein